MSSIMNNINYYSNQVVFTHAEAKLSYFTIFYISFYDMIEEMISMLQT